MLDTPHRTATKHAPIPSAAAAQTCSLAPPRPPARMLAVARSTQLRTLPLLRPLRLHGRCAAAAMSSVPAPVSAALSLREQLALLARALARTTGDAGDAGSLITARLPDGSLLGTPAWAPWDAVRPGALLHLDAGGDVLPDASAETHPGPVPRLAALHAALHRARPDAAVVVRQRPSYLAALLDAGGLALGAVPRVACDRQAMQDAARAVELATRTIGAAPLALLVDDGAARNVDAVVVAADLAAAYRRATALAERCRRAWLARAAGLTAPFSLLADPADRAPDAELVACWDAAVQRELRLDPGLLHEAAAQHGAAAAAATTPIPVPPGPVGAAPPPPPPAATGITHTDRLVRSARRYAARRSAHEHVDVRPRLRLAVVACMDSRMDLFGLLGLEVGDAHVLRNAGGVVTDDVIRSLALSQRVLGTTEIVLVHHTDCGMQRVRDDDFKAALEAETGIRPAWALENFLDPAADVRQSMMRIRSNPFLPHRTHVRGFVYDVDTYELREVEEGR